MAYSDLVYNLLQSLAWSITPALPIGAPGTRQPVGVPETIPDVTFIARTVTPADGIIAPPGMTAQQECNRLNGYIRDALTYHQLYGLAPVTVGSLEAIIDHFAGAAAPPIGRIRFVSHGNDQFLFIPMFANGDWGFGLHEEFLQALKDSDEGGLRYLMAFDATRSPIFTDIVASLTTCMRARNSAVLAPFGIQAGGAPPATAQRYFEVVNDLYQVSHGTVAIDTAGVISVATTQQKATLTDALNLIESALRRALVGTVFGATPITDAEIVAFRDAVLAEAPGPFGMFGGPVSLPAGTVAAVDAATRAVPPVENAIRMAFTGGAVVSPVFGIDHLTSLVRSLEMFNPGPLDVGGGALNAARIRADPDLEAFALVGVDLFLLMNGVVLHDGNALTTAERSTLRDGLLALSNIIRARLLAVPGTPFNATRLNAFRDALANIPYRNSTILGAQTFDSSTIPRLPSAVTAMRNGFRGKLDNFRTRMQPDNATFFDVRGCLVGFTPSFLTALSEFLGTAAQRPTVTAPEWFQSFPRGGHDFRPTNSVATAVANLLAAGSITTIPGPDVQASADVWRGLIDFDPHFDFLTALFAAGASKRDFVSLRWRVFQTPAAPHGIPVMRMQANRIDDIDTRTLAQVIERFRDIFEIPAGGVPSAATRAQLNNVQPHVVRFKTISDAIAATAAPTAAQLTQFKTDLVTVLAAITAVGLPGPAAPAAPAGATLAEVTAFQAAIAAHLDALLDGALDAFYAAMQAAIANPNARLNYFYNVGLPLLLQSSATPTSALVSVVVSPNNASVNALVGTVLRSWMRIQWQGTAAQAAAMNAHIDGVPMGTSAQRVAAAQLAMLSRDDPGANPASPAAVAPMPDFAAHIVRRP